LEDLKFQLKVANDSGETITLVRDPSGILSSRYRTEKFVIGTPDGRKAPPLFKGIKVKWSPERAAELGDTIVIGPGKTTHNIIDQDCEQTSKKRPVMHHVLMIIIVSRTYDFTAPGAGTYTFTPKNFFYIVDPVSREVRLVRAASVPAVSVRISGKLVIVDAGEPAQAQEPVTKFQDIEFVGGTPEQHVRIADVVQHAEQYIDNCNR
jgi:peptidyl-Lys metalloendopeptidase